MSENFQLKMKAFTCLLSASSAVLSSSICANFAQAQEVYVNGFESLPTEIVDDRTIKQAWSTRYAKGPDEGRVEIVLDAVRGKAARVLYPNGGNQSSPSGATWETDIQSSAEALYMSYWIKFDADFQFVKGGKLPGLAGSNSFPYGDNDFTTRLMWREEGRLEFYLHGYQLNNDEGAEPYRVFWDDFGEHAQLIPGQWHHIEIFQRLNTPGQRDGNLKGWLDGNLMIDDTSNSGVRDAGQSSTKINQLFFSTFFGGSSAPASQWQPTQDVYANFDEFVVSTQRIGMNGTPVMPTDNLAPVVSFTSPDHDLVVKEGEPLSFSASANDSDGVVTKVELFVDNHLIRQIDTAPYTWGTSPFGDELSSLGLGSFEVLVIATDDKGASAQDSFTLTIQSDLQNDPTCLLVNVENTKQEVSLDGKSCIEFDQNLLGKKLAIWDSDTPNACDFRATLSSDNGSGSLIVDKNYKASDTLSGSIFNVNMSASSTCELLKIRAW